MGLHERREERREQHEERREERHHRHDGSQAGDYYSGDREGNQYGRGGYAPQGYGAPPSYGSAVSQTGGRGYAPGYMSQDSNLYKNDDCESNNRSNVPYASQVHGYGTGGAYARPHDSTNETYSSAYAPSHPAGAPFGTPGLDGGRPPTTFGSSHSPYEGYKAEPDTSCGGRPSGDPDHRGDAEYGGPKSQYGDSGYEERGSRYGASQGYSGGQGHRDNDESYGRAPQGPIGPGSGAGGYASGGPRREGLDPGVGYAGRDSSYGAPQSYGGPRHGDDRDEYSAKSSSYNPPQSYGASRNHEDRDEYPGAKGSTAYNVSDPNQYSGAKSSGYGPPESKYGTNISACDTSRPYGGSRRGDGGEYSNRTTQSSGFSSGPNTPAGGFLSGSGGVASTRDDAPGPAKGGYGGRDSGPGTYGSERRGDYDDLDSSYESKTSSSGYDAPRGKPPGYGDGRRRDEDTYSGTPAHGRPQRNDYDDDDDERDKRQQQQHLDAHARVYGPGGDSNAPADPDVLGAAAAVEALKLTAAGKHSEAGGRPGGRRPNADDDDAGYSNAPAGGLQPNKPTGGRKSSYDDDDDEDASPAPTSKGSSMQDKIVSLAMSQAGKLFDKKNGGSGGSGDSAGKSDAMQTAAATAMKLIGGGGNLGPEEMQKLVGAAMSMF